MGFNKGEAEDTTLLEEHCTYPTTASELIPD